MTSELLLLAQTQLAIMDRHFGDDAAAEQVAFEKFGQGIHFDPRWDHGIDRTATSRPPPPPSTWRR